MIERVKAAADWATRDRHGKRMDLMDVLGFAMAIAAFWLLVYFRIQ